MADLVEVDVLTLIHFAVSEELKDASIQLPRAMLWATFANGIMGITMIITFCFCITDLSEIIGDNASEVPVINVIFNATGSYAATCVLGSLLVVLLFFSTVTTIASASRQLWAFSRDRVSLQCPPLLQQAADHFLRASHIAFGSVGSHPAGIFPSTH
jgi:amino acid transporter